MTQYTDSGLNNARSCEEFHIYQGHMVMVKDNIDSDGWQAVCWFPGVASTGNGNQVQKSAILS